MCRLAELENRDGNHSDCDDDYQSDLQLVPRNDCGALHRISRIVMIILKSAEEISEILVSTASHFFGRSEERDLSFIEHGNLCRHPECRSNIVCDHHARHAQFTLKLDDEVGNCGGSER